MAWTEGRIPRFHPVVIGNSDGERWYVCDGDARTEHTLAVPYIEEPCEDRDEAVALSAILNEDEATKET